MIKLRLNIFSKLFLAMLLATALVVLVMSVLMNWDFQHGFTNYLQTAKLKKAEQLVQVLERAYEKQGNWDFFRHEPWLWREFLKEIGTRPPPPKHRRPPRPNHQEGYPLLDHFDEHFPPKHARKLKSHNVHKELHLHSAPLGARLYLLDSKERFIAGNPVYLKQPIKDKQLHKLKIYSDKTLVGWLYLHEGKVMIDQLSKAFLDQQMRHVYLIALFAIGLSFILAGLLVKHLLKPVRLLTTGAQALTNGYYQTRIDVAAKDELGELAQDFNALAETLQHNETTRKQWIADISHELRTPIAILRSEIEAMLDGIREPSLDYIQSLHADVMSLGQLVDDLYQISLSDSMEMDTPAEHVNIIDILASAANSAKIHLQEKNITLCCRFDITLEYWLKGDTKRLFLLFSNLLLNAHRYTNEGGNVEIFLKPDNQKLGIIIQDSDPGVPDESLARLFERLYRVDKSRSRALGGSGLGLSVCKSIVESHGGKIWADHSTLGGLAIHIQFPIQD